MIAKISSAEPLSAQQGERVVFTVRERDVKRFDRDKGLRVDTMGGQ